jgi:hypothetical protein
MVIIRGIFAAFAIVALAACTNPFAPDDGPGNPPDPERNGGQDDQQGFMQDRPDVHFA